MYLAVLGRQSEISLAELEAQFDDVKKINDRVALFESDVKPEIARLGGSIKLAKKMNLKPLDFLAGLPEGKLTIGVSDYTDGTSKKLVTAEALKMKKILVRHGRSVRIVENKEAALSSATSLHNGLSGKNERKVELIRANDEWYLVFGVQDIDAYVRRDQARPARDAKVGMLPPKLAQILINLCGRLPEGARVLDPFCGTGVVLQEAALMGYKAYGTDIDARMCDYSQKNMDYLGAKDYEIEVGDAKNYEWESKIDAVACEGYLGRPMSQIPSEIKLKTEMQECKAILFGFLRNLAKQIKAGTPVTVAMPAWLNAEGTYVRLGIDEIESMGYNVNNKSREGLLYFREGQIVARDIIMLRKR